MYMEQRNMSELIETNFNIETGQTTQRPLTKSEIDELTARQLIINAEVAQAELNRKAKEDIFIKLGITADEAKILLS